MRSLLFFLCIALGACTSPVRDDTVHLLIPMPPAPIDPTDAIARTAMKDFLKKNNAPLSTQYDLRRYDLNGDGRRDAIAFLKSPYRYWCDMHGCSVVILKAHNDHFTVVNSIKPVRAPLYISPNKTKDWHDLIVRVSGRWSEARDVVLRYDGRTYPKNPDIAPNDPYYAFYDAQHSGIRLFHE